jgi:hypothetical protein
LTLNKLADDACHRTMPDMASVRLSIGNSNSASPVAHEYKRVLQSEV